ncbi:2-oxoglutarate and iron-dependent oxygenase domain-containing protein [Myxococcus sp. 1LA]
MPGPDSAPGGLPVIDMASLFDTTRVTERARVAREIEQACRDSGFFYVTGHGVSADVLARLERESHRFFALPRAAKEAIAMAKGGVAWRGWFPLGGELTSGMPDRKEGLYLGTELGSEHPRVKAGWRCTAPTCGPGRCRSCARRCSTTWTPARAPRMR